MGQKISAKAVRVGVNETWSSLWFADKKEYSKMIHQDRKAREYIEAMARHAGVDRIDIKRTANKIAIDLYVGRPGVVIGRGGKGVDDLKKGLGKVFGEKMVELEIHEVQPFLSAAIVAYNVGEAMKKGIRPNMAMSQQLEKIKGTPAKGARIWVAGFGPIKQARTLKKEYGAIPLSTLRAEIDFAKTAVLTKERLMGIKVWIYKGEKLGY